MKSITKILFSLLTVGVVAGAAFYGTTAFFSDTETSAGNTFTAGSIDLQVSSHYSDYAGQRGFDAKNLNGDPLFSFEDMKPGDTGGGRFDIVANTNPYWACMKATVDTMPENTVIEPETGDTTEDVGELQNYLSFYFWNDLNGDGAYTPGDLTVDRNLVGPLTLAQVQAAGYLPLGDATGVHGPSFFSGEPLVPGQTYNLGYKYCFGDWAIDGSLACTGEGDQNDAQTDGVTGTIEFYAVQSRSNEDFVCSSMNPVFVLDQEASGANVGYNEDNQIKGWPYISWVINGDEITFTAINPTGITSPFYFDYQVDGESGNPVPGVSGLNSPSGRLQGLAWGDFYNYLIVGPGETKSVTVQGNSDIRIRLRLGPERDYDFNWIVFKAE